MEYTTTTLTLNGVTIDTSTPLGSLIIVSELRSNTRTNGNGAFRVTDLRRWIEKYWLGEEQFRATHYIPGYAYAYSPLLVNKHGNPTGCPVVTHKGKLGYWTAGKYTMYSGFPTREWNRLYTPQEYVKYAAAKAKRDATRKAKQEAQAARIAEEQARIKAEQDARIAEALRTDPRVKFLFDTKCSKFIESLRDQYRTRGELSEKQWAVIQRQIDAAENAPAEPLTAGRQTLTGQIIRIKEIDGPYGHAIKATIHLKSGHRVYGTLPAPFGPQNQGQQITFTATVQPKDGDPSFAFYSRPANAARA